MITLNSSYVGTLHVFISRIINAVQVCTSTMFLLIMLKRRNRPKIVALAYIWLQWRPFWILFGFLGRASVEIRPFKSWYGKNIGMHNIKSYLYSKRQSNHARFWLLLVKIFFFRVPPMAAILNFGHVNIVWHYYKRFHWIPRTSKHACTYQNCVSSIM